MLTSYTPCRRQQSTSIAHQGMRPMITRRVAVGGAEVDEASSDTSASSCSDATYKGIMQTSPRLTRIFSADLIWARVRGIAANCFCAGCSTSAARFAPSPTLSSPTRRTRLAVSPTSESSFRVPRTGPRKAFRRGALSIHRSLDLMCDSGTERGQLRQVWV